MTAINVVLQPRHRRLHVATDGAMYSDDATVVAMGSKVFPLPHWPGVVTTRGPALATAMLGQGLGMHLRSFDDAVERIEKLLPVLAANCEGVSQGMSYAGIQVIIAGWSQKRDAPEAYLIQTDAARPDMENHVVETALANGGYNPDAYQLVKLDDVACAPDVNPDTDLARAVTFEGLAPDDLPGICATDLTKCLEVQRRTPFERFGELQFTVGCFGQLTTVHANGAIDQRILVRWDDDVVGSKIAPRPFKKQETVVQMPAGLSRQQRRAWQAENRR